MHPRLGIQAVQDSSFAAISIHMPGEVSKQQASSLKLAVNGPYQGATVSKHVSVVNRSYLWAAISIHVPVEA